MTAPTIAAASVALSPADAACTDHAGTASPPPKARAVPVCQTTGTDAVSGVGPGGAGGACGRDAQASPAVPCLVCGDPAVAGDDLALCSPHGGLSWADFDEAAWLAGREAC